MYFVLCGISCISCVCYILKGHYIANNIAHTLQSAALNQKNRYKHKLLVVAARTNSEIVCQR